MTIGSVTLKKFRCFDRAEFLFDAPIILIKGKNGSGKTSLLEALYYAGHLRSFRTHLPKELIKSENEAFSIKVGLSSEEETHELQVGFSPDKRSVKINGKSVSSYKDLFHYLRVISMSEDDLMLIKGSPEQRRSFIDSALLIEDPHNAKLLSRYRHVLASRNALLKQPVVSKDMYDVWTQQLWELSLVIKNHRTALITQLEERTNEIVAAFIPDCPAITCAYQIKHEAETLEEAASILYQQETRARRSLFGAHLDDIAISFNNKSSKIYASRGQQKLTVLMLKIAHIIKMQESNKPITAFLLDDFMTDFDETRIEQILPLLKSLGLQLVFTCPTNESPLEKALSEFRLKVVTL